MPDMLANLAAITQTADSATPTGDPAADTFTTIALVVLTLLTLAAWMVAWLRYRRVAAGGEPAEGAALQSGLIAAVIALAAATLTYRTVEVHRAWQPLEAHVDGLLLIGVLVTATVTYLVRRSRVRGLSLFALPLLAILFAWAICANLWTFRLFGPLTSIWMAVHLGSVYIGAAFIVIAAIAGGMYLFVQRKLRISHDPSQTRPFASLERIEALIIHTSALGFALLTLGLVTGLIIVTSGPTRLGDGWWHSPKVVLAAAVWLIYALVMNVKHTVNFRGARAAWLSIAGLVLLLATFGIAINLPPLERRTEPRTSEETEVRSEEGRASGSIMYAVPSCLRATVPSCLSSFLLTPHSSLLPSESSRCAS